MVLDIADFDFALPPDRIAQHPARPRDAARLLHVGRDGLADRVVRELPQLLRPGDVLVANDTRVIPAQLVARRGNARIGITLDRPLGDGTVEVRYHRGRRVLAHLGQLSGIARIERLVKATERTQRGRQARCRRRDRTPRCAVGDDVRQRDQ